MFGFGKKSETAEEKPKFAPALGQLVSYIDDDDNTYYNGYVDSVFDSWYFVRVENGCHIKVPMHPCNDINLHTEDGKPAIACTALVNKCDEIYNIREEVKKFKLLAKSKYYQNIIDGIIVPETTEVFVPVEAK